MHFSIVLALRRCCIGKQNEKERILENQVIGGLPHFVDRIEKLLFARRQEDCALLLRHRPEASTQGPLKKHAQPRARSVIISRRLARRVENSPPVILFEVRARLDVDKSLDGAACLADGEHNQPSRPLKFPQKGSDNGRERAPLARELTCSQVPRTLMLRARQHTIADRTVRQRSPQMRADVRRRVHLPVVVARHQNALTSCVDCLEVARRDLRRRQQRHPRLRLHARRRAARRSPSGCGRCSRATHGIPLRARARTRAGKR